MRVKVGNLERGHKILDTRLREDIFDFVLLITNFDLE